MQAMPVWRTALISPDGVAIPVDQFDDTVRPDGKLLHQQPIVGRGLAEQKAVLQKVSRFALGYSWQASMQEM